MRRLFLGVMSTLGGLVLLFSYHTSLGGQTLATTATGGTTDGTAADDMAAGAGTVAGAATGGKTITGAVASTVWGNVQVQITVKSGKITAARALKSPNDTSRSLSINKAALPKLNAETVAANSAKIDAVSGASVTSGGYTQSLQSAIDKAHL